MKYVLIRGKLGQIKDEIEASTDRLALEEAAKMGGVRVVKKGEITIFEDWDRILVPDHPIFSTLPE